MAPPGHLAAGLRARRGEIEDAVLARVHAVSDPAEVGDSGYTAGLKTSVAAGVELGIVAIETGGEAPLRAPPELLSQAREAARNAVSLDTVLRRYFAGYALIEDVIVGEAERRTGATAELQRALRSLAPLFDRVVAEVSDEHTRELHEYSGNEGERRRVERVRELLSGRLLDIADFGYELDAWHIGAIAAGAGAGRALRSLAAALGRDLLAVQAGDRSLWAWLGGPRRLESRQVMAVSESGWPEAVCLAVGEPAHGIEGWRLTHRQARAAMAVAQLGARRVRYSGVALLASALGDEVLARSLQDIYLLPLRAERDGGAALMQTLQAYFSTGHNVSSAAASLGVNRKTVTLRLRAVEERIGRPLEECAAELQTALTLGGLVGLDGA